MLGLGQRMIYGLSIILHGGNGSAAAMNEQVLRRAKYKITHIIKWYVAPFHSCSLLGWQKQLLNLRLLQQFYL